MFFLSGFGRHRLIGRPLLAFECPRLHLSYSHQESLLGFGCLDCALAQSGEDREQVIQMLGETGRSQGLKLPTKRSDSAGKSLVIFTTQFHSTRIGMPWIMIGKPPFSEKRFAAAQQRFRRALRRAYLAAAGTVWAASRRRASFPYTSRRVGMGSNLPPLSNDHRLSLVSPLQCY